MQNNDFFEESIESRDAAALGLANEDFKLKLKAIIQSRWQLKQRNEELEAELEALSRENDALKKNPLPGVNPNRDEDLTGLQNEIQTLKQLCRKLYTENSKLKADLAAVPESAEITEENISEKLGNLILAAQAGGEKLIDAAKAEVEGFRRSKKEMELAILSDIDALLKDIDTTKSQYIGLLASMNVKFDSLSMTLIETKKKVNTFSE